MRVNQVDMTGQSTPILMSGYGIGSPNFIARRSSVEAQVTQMQILPLPEQIPVHVKTQKEMNIQVS